MFSLSRHNFRPCSHLFRRHFAEIVSLSAKPSGAPPQGPGDPSQQRQTSGPNADTAQSTTPQTIAPVRNGNRVQVRDDHGLYGFFRQKEQGKDGKTFVGEARYETLGGGIYQENVQSGRSWKAAELRLKSFNDLHTLWYILLRERNLLATQKEEVRRMGVAPVLQSFSYKVRQCRKSMARIKYVLNERRLAYDGAVKLAEKEKQDHLDQVVLHHQLAEYHKERKYYAKRDTMRGTEHRQDSGSTSLSRVIKHPTGDDHTEVAVSTSTGMEGTVGKPNPSTQATGPQAASAGIFGQKQ
ncbi:MRP-L47-domain-containing protein [Marasmius fiardii PR-910]|nr:MRP-L47-domain-containing protein [Marasmius fiardii PR-910]